MNVNNTLIVVEFPTRLRTDSGRSPGRKLMGKLQGSVTKMKGKPKEFGDPKTVSQMKTNAAKTQ